MKWGLPPSSFFKRKLRRPKAWLTYRSQNICFRCKFLNVIFFAISWVKADLFFFFFFFANDSYAFKFCCVSSVHIWCIFLAPYNALISWWIRCLLDAFSAHKLTWQFTVVPQFFHQNLSRRTSVSVWVRGLCVFLCTCSVTLKCAVGLISWNDAQIAFPRQLLLSSAERYIL